MEWFTGYDRYASADLTLGVDAYFTAVGGTPTITASAVRNGTNGIRMTTSQWGIVGGLANAATRCFGSGIRSANTTSSGRCFCVIADGDPTQPSEGQVGLMFDGSGRIEVRRAVGIFNTTAGTLLGTTTNAMSSNTYYFLELLVTIHNTLGSVALYVNNVLWLELTNVDTQSTANAHCNVVAFSGLSGVNMDYDDSYISLTREGDGKSTAIVASTGDGALAQFTPSSGADNGAMVDETNPDGDTTYNESTVVDDVDVYDFAALSSVGVIRAVQVANYVKKTDAGTCEVAPVLRIAGVNYVGTSKAVSQTYGFTRQVYLTNPATGLPWTEADVDGTAFGVKHTA